MTNAFVVLSLTKIFFSRFMDLSPPSLYNISFICILKFPDFEFNCDWICDYRKDSSPHDYVHCIKNTVSNRCFIEKWISVIDKQQKGSHTAFINIYSILNIKRIPEGYVQLGLSPHILSKKKYFS